ncbi:imelysin family protein, partial [Bacillus sp. SIMBA_069]
VPVTRNDLIPAAKTYAAWVSARIPVLRTQVSAVAADAEEGDLSAARRDWLTAHTTYETLGAAYGAFGDLGDQLDGL